MRVREFLLVGVIFMVTGVVLGAFGAHSLKDSVEAVSLEVFKTGVFYQLIHGVALLVLAVISRHDQRIDRLSGRLIWVGTTLFSGSLYLLATKSLLGIDSFVQVLGPITPIGGSLMILGWIIFLYRILRGESV